MSRPIPASALLAASLIALSLSPPARAAPEAALAPVADPAPAALPAAPPVVDGYLMLASMVGSVGGWMMAGAITQTALLPLLPGGLTQTVTQLAAQVGGAMLGSSYARHLYADALVE